MASRPAEAAADQAIGLVKRLRLSFDGGERPEAPAALSAVAAVAAAAQLAAPASSPELLAPCSPERGLQAQAWQGSGSGSLSGSGSDGGSGTASGVDGPAGGLQRQRRGALVAGVPSPPRGRRPVVAPGAVFSLLRSYGLDSLCTMACSVRSLCPAAFCSVGPFQACWYPAGRPRGRAPLLQRLGGRPRLLARGRGPRCGAGSRGSSS